MQRLILFLLTYLFAFSTQAAVDIQHWVTQTGARVYFVENHDLPIMDIAVTFRAGGAYDSPEKVGLAGITHHLMDTGVDGMNEEQITNAFADIGAQLGGSAGKDSAGFSIRTLTSEQDQALRVFNKILHTPTFPQTVLAREKKRAIARIKEAKTKPNRIAAKAFKKAIFGNHPYGLQSTETTVDSLNVADLQAFYQKHYTAKSAVIAMMGDMTKAQAKTIANNISAGLPQGEAITPVQAVAPIKAAQQINKPHPASQAHIFIGQPGVKRGDPDYFALYVGNYILGGGGFVSRLTEEVREKRGLAYSAYSYFSPMAEAGPFTIGLQTKKSQAQEALAVVNKTVADFIANGITAKELQAAKDNIIGGFPMRIDSNRKILGYLSTIGFYNLPPTYLADFNQRIENVTVQQVNDAFKRRLKQEKFATVVVGGEVE